MEQNRIMNQEAIIEGGRAFLLLVGLLLSSAAFALQPTITVTGANPAFVNEGDLYVDEGATASDFEDDDATLTLAIVTDNPVNTNIPGTYTVTYTVTDTDGEMGSATRTVNVNATPILTVVGSNPASVNQDEVYNDAGATASDAEDNDVALTNAIVTDNPVNTAIPGSYTVTYTVTDSGGATATATRTVNVNARPVITVVGDNPASIIEGGTYVDAGATASDVEDNDATLTTAIVTDNPVDTSTPDTYTVTYTVTDSGGATAIATRTVNVGANAAPTITVLGNNPESVGEGNVYLDAGATASDVEDDDATLTAAIVTDNPVDTSIPGAYTVTYTVTDSGGKMATATRTVNVVANAPPVITVIGNDPESVIEGGIYVDAGATASDVEDDDATLTAAIVTDNPVDTSIPGAYTVTYTVTDSGGETAIATRIVNVVANAPPTITVLGNNPESVGEGDVYTDAGATASDAEDDDAVLTAAIITDNPVDTNIPGAYTVTYTVTDSGGKIATATRTVDVIANTPPQITTQAVLETPEETLLTITLADVTVTDPDSVFPDVFTLSIQDGANYVRSGADGNSITPVLDFNGALSVPATVNDGFNDSPVFNLVVTVTPVNDQPQFGGLVAPLSTLEDTTLTIVLTDLVILDPDNVFPTDFTLTLDPVVGPNYTLAGATSITPAENFNGQLNVRATVSDGLLTSPTFLIPVTVDAVNDLPVLLAPIGPNNAIEDSPFSLDVTGNFDDADGEALSYTADWVPSKPPNINFNGANGQFSGTPRFVDTEPPAGPVYQVTVTAQDPAGAFVSDTFELTISALGRANLDLSIGVTPDTAMPGDDLRWTFTSRNQVGPVAGANVELTGSFIGAGLTVTAEGGANCAIQAPVNDVTAFVCVLGSIPVGASTSTVLTTATSQASEVVSFGTVAGTERIPIDPNLDDNSDIEAAGVADAFSVGAVQNLSGATVRSVDAGDVNNDGRIDLVIGTAAGTGIQIFLGAEPRDTCQCQRDFQTPPLTIPDSGSNEGVALGHFNGDNALDLVVANGGGQIDRVYLNDGAGNFAEVTPAPLGATFAQDVAVGDFDNDGDTDIAIAANGGNPVYLGTGNGGFNLHATLGNRNSVAVDVARFDSGNRDDLVFANVSDNSTVYTKNNNGFTLSDQLNIGDAVAVAASDLNNDGRPDLVFGRIPTLVGNDPRNPDTPSNPVLINNGNGTFPNAASALLGVSPTNDVHIGDVNEDGSKDFVFVGASGVHQIWTASGGGYTLHSEQIIDSGAMSGVLVELGDADSGDPGGVDLAMGGAAQGGLAVYLNDSFGNLGRGDAVPPELTLLGQAAVSITAKSAYNDAGATALDNIDGDISGRVTVSGSVNTSSVGDYILTYNVVDFAGNSAAPITRTVTVTPGGGGGGGGSISILTLLLMLAGLLVSQGYRETLSIRQKVV